MPRHPRRSRRLLIPLVLATVLAGEVAGFAAAAALDASHQPAPAPERAQAIPVTDPLATAQAARSTERAAPASRRAAPASVLAARGTTSDHTRPSQIRAAAPRPQLAATPRSVTTGASSRHGRNHVWMPALGINRSVETFPCSRTRPPDNYVYRWGCAGRNNVYLLGHAYSVFKTLHDAYVSGRLRKGMTVDYADGNGRVRTYAVAWWKTTRPTGAAAWAWAAQSRPSMTLQTCVGANSEYRLIVRLIATN
jgi:hypothetical protein